MSADIKERVGEKTSMWMNSVFARLLAGIHGYTTICGVKTTAL